MTGILAIVLDNGDMVKHAAFADDLFGAGLIESLKIWWDAIIKVGPLLGYTAKPSKSWLIIKEQYLELAKSVFIETGINITTEGRRHQGAIVGSEAFQLEYVNNKIDEWIKEILALSEIAKIEPHAAYAAFIHGMQHKYTYIMRTIPNIAEPILRLDQAITDHFIKALFVNQEFSEQDRVLFSLPVKLGGLGVSLFHQKCLKSSIIIP